MTFETRSCPPPDAFHVSDRHAPADAKACNSARSSRRLAKGMAIALFAAAQLNAQTIDTSAPLPPVRAWHGASEALIAAPDDPWITPTEHSDFVSTPSYAQTRAWLQRLVAASPLLSLEVFGKTGEGRELLLVRARKGKPGKPVVLAQAGIHGGEIDGKDAGLMLLRDIAQRGKDALLDEVDFVFVPILNSDGHEQRGPLIGAALRGPQQMGWNTTTRGINLNRDYLNLEAPETRAIVTLLHTLDPALYIDLHVSGGLDHQYDITFTFAGWGTYARSRATASWLQQRFTPAVDAALRRQGHQPAIYPSLIDEDAPRSGLRYSPEGPRYSTGYGDFAGIPTVLVENHRLKSYRQRVLGDYVLLEEALRLVGRDAHAIDAAKRADRAARPQELMVAWERLPQPIDHIPFKGVTYTRALSRCPAGRNCAGKAATKPGPCRSSATGRRRPCSTRWPGGFRPATTMCSRCSMRMASATTVCSSRPGARCSRSASPRPAAIMSRTPTTWKKPFPPAAPIAGCMAPSWSNSANACCVAMLRYAARSNKNWPAMRHSAPMAMRACSGFMHARPMQRSAAGGIRCGAK